MTSCDASSSRSPAGELGSAVAPRQIEFSEHLPLTQSGKIMRRVLKARELGLPEGDLSTMGTSP